MTMSISYETGVDGFGSEQPTAEDIASFEALVEHRLSERFPGAEVSVDVSSRHLESRVRIDGADHDEEEIRQWIGVDVWEAWCAGERAPSGNASVA